MVGTAWSDLPEYTDVRACTDRESHYVVLRDHSCSIGIFAVFPCIYLFGIGADPAFLSWESGNEPNWETFFESLCSRMHGDLCDRACHRYFFRFSIEQRVYLSVMGGGKYESQFYLLEHHDQLYISGDDRIDHAGDDRNVGKPYDTRNVGGVTMQTSVITDIGEYEENILAGMTARQLILSVVGIILTAAAYFWAARLFSIQEASYLAIGCGLPCFLFAFAKPHKMALERFLAIWLESELLSHRKRWYIAENTLYEAVAEKEYSTKRKKEE